RVLRIQTDTYEVGGKLRVDVETRKRSVLNNEFQNRPEEIGGLVIPRSQPQFYSNVPQLPTRNKTPYNSRPIAPSSLLEYRGAKGQSASHRPLLSGHPSYVVVPHLISLLLCTDPSLTCSHLSPTAFHLPFFSIILSYPSIAFGLLLFSVLVEPGTWYARRFKLIYHHY
ncbi:uncharacterized protein N7500_000995, partial [Penicillium coprophilum]|uniref:uncharacterized protein n=1 Tax=Penicillium coprophilum TaxID=36646 RepID=UPI0023928A11